MESRSGDNLGEAGGGHNDIVPHAFLSPKLEGSRFDHHSIPLELLTDISAIESLIKVVARIKYLEENQDRKRCPNGFTSGIRLELSGVEQGSAIANIGLAFSSAIVANSQEFEPYYVSARDTVVAAIAAAESNSGEQITQVLPQHALAYFDRIGRNLQDGEAVVFGQASGESHTTARLTRNSRRALLLASQAEGYREDIRVRGIISEMDHVSKTFTLIVPDGTKLVVPTADEYYQTAIEVFSQYPAEKVLLDVTATITRTGSISKIEAVAAFDVLHSRDPVFSLQQLKTLKNGWLDGEGVAYSPEYLDDLSALFEAHYETDLDPAYIYPSPEGGISVEWTFGSVEISMEIGSDGKNAEWHSINVADGNVVERSLDIHNPDEWSWIASKIRACMESSND